jgi:hypothetical protein
VHRASRIVHRVFIPGGSPRPRGRAGKNKARDFPSTEHLRDQAGNKAEFV